MDHPWMSMDNPWTSLDFHGLPGAGGTGRPCLGSWPAHSGGTARAGNINAFLIQKVRTPSGKPGWGNIDIANQIYQQIQATKSKSNTYLIRFDKVFHFQASDTFKL